MTRKLALCLALWMLYQFVSSVYFLWMLYQIDFTFTALLAVMYASMSPLIYSVIFILSWSVDKKGTFLFPQWSKLGSTDCEWILY